MSVIIYQNFVSKRPFLRIIFDVCALIKCYNKTGSTTRFVKFLWAI